MATPPEEVHTSQTSSCESSGSLHEYVIVGAESLSKDVHNDCYSLIFGIFE